MSSTNWKNHAPASVAAAIVATARAATSAGLDGEPANDDLAVAASVTAVSSDRQRVLSRGTGAVEAGAITLECLGRGPGPACRRKHDGNPSDGTALRVAPPPAPVIFRRLRAPASTAGVPKAPVAELVD